MTPLEAALAYAARGWRVFPLAPGSKLPAIPKDEARALSRGWQHGGHGCRDATTDVVKIQAWWRNCSRANVGIATGASSRIFVVDLDCRDAAIDFRSRFDIGAPLIQRTPRGWHLLYEWSADCEGLSISAGMLGSGIDTRGEGGYIVAWPSVRDDGGAYSWLNDLGLSPPPAELIAACKRPRLRKVQPASEPLNDNAGPDSRYGLAALAAECEAIGRAMDGAQERTLNGSAFKIGGLVAGGELSRSTAWARLTRAGLGMASHNPRDPWTSEVVAAKVDTALAAGAGMPRRASARTATGRVGA